MRGKGRENRRQVKRKTEDDRKKMANKTRGGEWEIVRREKGKKMKEGEDRGEKSEEKNPRVL